MSHTNLHIDILRTLVLGFELGSFSKAAERLGRSQSAISTQLRRIEDQVGQPLVRKAGRKLEPTAAGERLISYARRILELNDEAVEALRSDGLAGTVRLGLPQEFAETWLPRALSRFARAHPKVRIEVKVDRSAVLNDALAQSGLDLILAWGEPDSDGELVAELPLAWIGSRSWNNRPADDEGPLPLVAFERPCMFRSAGIAALDEAGIAWRIAFTSPSLSGLWAATEAGLGITLRTPAGMPQTLRALTHHGLPALPSVALRLRHGIHRPSRASHQLAEIVRDLVQEGTRGIRRSA